MLIQCVDRERPRWVGRARQDVFVFAYSDDIRRVTASSTLGVIGMDRSAFKSFDSLVDKATFIERIGMYVDLFSHLSALIHPDLFLSGGRNATYLYVVFIAHGQ